MQVSDFFTEKQKTAERTEMVFQCCLQIAKVSFGIFFLTFPFQIGTLVFSHTPYFTGNFNIYTSFFITVSDFFLISAFIAWSIFIFGTKKTVKTGNRYITAAYICFLFFCFLSIIPAQDKLLSTLHAFRWFELMLLYFLTINEILSFRKILGFLLIGMSFEAFIGIIQYLKQGSIGLHFLGEPAISSEFPGVAKMDVSNLKIARIYGTFGHPNIFAGALVFSFYALFLKRKKKSTLKIFYLMLLGTALILTFSRSAFLGVGIGFLIYYIVTKIRISWKQIFFSGFVTAGFLTLINAGPALLQRLFFDNNVNAFNERLEYIEISKKIFLDMPSGTGLGHFTFFMQDYTSLKLDPWLFQPVHNIFLLAANETGFFGALSFLCLFIFSFVQLLKSFRLSHSDHQRSAQLFMALLTSFSIIGLFDHYFFSLLHGQILLVLTFSLISCFLQKTAIPSQKFFN